MFSYKNGEFYVEDVPVSEIADQLGTPCYVYSYKFIEDTYNEYKEAFSEIEPIICYSAKANSNLSILKVFSSLDCGFDIVSVGELKKVLTIGADPKKIVFSGVGKTRDEIIAAIEAEILFFNVESVAELEFINEIAISIGKKASSPGGILDQLALERRREYVPARRCGRLRPCFRFPRLLCSNPGRHR